MQFLPMHPTPFERRNALLDFSPIGDAIESNRRNALARAEERRQEEELAMRRQAHQRAQEQEARSDQRDNRAWFGKQAYAVSRLPAGPARALAWKRLVERTGSQSLTSEELDPITGPQLMMAEAGLYVDPREEEMANIELAMKRLALENARNPGQDRLPADLQTWEMFRGMTPEEQQQFIALKTGRVAGDDEVERAEALTAARTRGKLQAEAAQRLPEAEQAAATTLQYIDAVLADPNLPNVTGWQSRLPTVTSESADTESRIAQLGGRAFLAAFERLRGAGQISEQEGQRAMEALARLTNMRQSDAGYVQALHDFRREVLDLLEVARRKAGGGASAASRVSGAPSEPSETASGNDEWSGWSMRGLD